MLETISLATFNDRMITITDLYYVITIGKKLLDGLSAERVEKIEGDSSEDIIKNVGTDLHELLLKVKRGKSISE